MSSLNASEALMSRYPSVAYLEERARRRIPHFAWEYLASGTGTDACVRRNRAALDEVTLTPRFMQGTFEPEITTTLFGVEYAAPFGVAPVGLTGLMWPHAERILARAAARQRIPYTLSTVATEAPETIGPLAGEMAWFQLYPPRREEVRHDLLVRARDAGFRTLLVTVDVPTGSRRERQVRAGVSIPPRMTPLTLYRAALRPAWSLATLGAGTPRFRGLEKYLESRDMLRMVGFIGRELSSSIDWAYLERVRNDWDGPMVLKGVLHPEEAERAVEIGLDGVLVSNHGGRQLDAAPATIRVLPAIVEAVGRRTKVLFDSGARGGLDIARAIALGADFVLLGRAFMFGVAALAEHGGDHVAEILKADLANNMTQLGCRTLTELQERL